jgi:hypothetical protein
MTYKVCYWDEIERCQKERDATPEETAEIDALKEQAPIKERETLYNSIVAATQARLDDFAKTRGYDGILSAVSYADSPTTKFKIEGQYCLTQRDATWAALIQMFNEVQAGTRPVPSGYQDIEGDLPPLVWPN